MSQTEGSLPSWSLRSNGREAGRPTDERYRAPPARTPRGERSLVPSSQTLPLLPALLAPAPQLAPSPLAPSCQVPVPSYHPVAIRQPGRVLLRTEARLVTPAQTIGGWIPYIWHKILPREPLSRIPSSSFSGSHMLLPRTERPTLNPGSPRLLCLAHCSPLTASDFKRHLPGEGTPCPPCVFLFVSIFCCCCSAAGSFSPWSLHKPL